MKLLIVLGVFIAVASADIIYSGNYHYPHYAVGYHPHHPYAYTTAGVIHPGVVSHQYHAQDELGQYSYGYSGGPSAKHESKSYDGVTRGEYSYIDGHGLVQKTAYTADPIHGFRVAATNLPIHKHTEGIIGVVDTPEVEYAKALHFKAHQEALLKLRKRRSPQVIPHHPFVGEISTVQNNAAIHSGIHHTYTPTTYTYPYHHYGYHY